MKEYLKPELEMLAFETEVIASNDDMFDGEPGDASNVITEGIG